MYSKCLVTKWPNCTILHLQYYNTIKYSVKTLSTDYIKNDIVERKQLLKYIKDYIKNKYKLDIDCVLERTRGMLAEVTFDPTGQV